MPGQPKTRALKSKIREFGVERVFDLHSNGETISLIATKIGVERQVLAKFISKPEYSAQLEEARRLAADAKVELNSELAAKANRLTERVVKLQMDHNRWLASKWDRKQYGDDQASINISLNSMHLDALRKRQAPDDYINHSIGNVVNDDAPRTLRQRTDLSQSDKTRVANDLAAGVVDPIVAYQPEHNQQVNAGRARDYAQGTVALLSTPCEQVNTTNAAVNDDKKQ